VGISHCRRKVAISGTFELHCLVENFARGAGYADFFGLKADLAHLHCNQPVFLVDRAGYDSAGCFDREPIIAHFSLIQKITAKDAQAIAALFRFAPVRIENAQPEIRGRTLHRAVEDAI